LAPHLGVRRSGHGNTHGIRLARQFLKARENGRLKFFCNRGGTFWAVVVNTNQLHAAEFAVYARVIAPKFSKAHDGDTDFS
jgi:hypothetical protein